MKENSKLVPEIRFSGFTDAWEQRKLGEVSESYSGGTPSANRSEYYGGDIPFIRSAEINSNNTKLSITEDGLKSSSTRMVKTGDILYALYGATSGEVGISKINGAINQAILAIKPKFGYNSQFIMQLLRFKKQRITERYLQGGQGNLSGSLVKELEIPFPFTTEQTKIGTFFKQLDSTITLHQQKLAQLELMKKGYLQQLFPENGEKVPKVRFANFEGDWEQRKLGEEAEIYDGTHQTPKYTKSGVKFVSVENIRTLTTNKFISQESFDAEYSNKTTRLGDILMTRIGDIGTTKVIETDEKLAYYVTLALLKPKKVYSYFLAWLISSPTVQSNIWKRTLHIAFPQKINLGEINQVDLFVPKNKEEQEKIGVFFKQLDYLVDLHKQKIEKLKLIKKALLQKMFI